MSHFVNFNKMPKNLPQTHFHQNRGFSDLGSPGTRRPPGHPSLPEISLSPFLTPHPPLPLILENAFSPKNGLFWPSQPHFVTNFDEILSGSKWEKNRNLYKLIKIIFI